MSKSHTQLYEGIYILNAGLSEEARAKGLEKLQQQITDKGGEVKKVHEWGRRRFAYEMNDKREGYYFILYFDLPTSAMKELWDEYHLNEDLVRFMTLTAETVAETIEFKQLANATS